MKRRALVGWAWLLVAVLAAGGGFLAGRATFAPPTTAVDRVPEPVYTVVGGAVGRSTQFPLGVRWPIREVGFAAKEGAVTEILADLTAPISAGMSLYSVDLRPVVAAVGTIPAFRDLTEGDTGADVRQLQGFLIGQGHLKGKADGRFGTATTAAVKAWQRALGVERTGTVGADDLVFVPDLPARLSFTDKVVVGARQQAGDATVTAIVGAPQFTIMVSSSAVPPEPGSPVTVTYGEHSWPGRIGSALNSDLAGETELLLNSINDEPLCGQECGVLPTVLKPEGGRVTVELVPEVTGPVVPIAALNQDPTGAATVTAQDGTTIPVTVLATDGSRAVVEGVAISTVIRVYADPPASADL